MKTFFTALILFIAFVSSAQKIIAFKKNGVIFTKEYFGNNKQKFTPSIGDLIDIEKQLRKSKEDFSGFYRQYIGINTPKNEIVVQLIPQSRVKLYKKWRTNYLRIQDDIEIRYAYYDLKTKKLLVKPKDKFGG